MKIKKKCVEDKIICSFLFGMGIYSLESVVLDRMTYSKRRNSCPPQAFGYANGQDWQSLLAQHALAQHGRNLHNMVWNRHSFISKWINEFFFSQLFSLQSNMQKWLYMINKSCFHAWVCSFCTLKQIPFCGQQTDHVIHITFSVPDNTSPSHVCL